MFVRLYSLQRTLVLPVMFGPRSIVTRVLSRARSSRPWRTAAADEKAKESSSSAAADLWTTTALSESLVTGWLARSKGETGVGFTKSNHDDKHDQHIFHILLLTELK
jgi:hypothetical protein